ncbi:MAG TPA: hypothetical protein VHW46_13210 [Terracidiphilus sp.]|jgi:hypothetical protein|nr:hypothetical protein [Terracidiphilus sp.]
MSAAVRSLVYLIAMARVGAHGRLAVVAIEMAYVTLTAGTYAGMQQRALALRSHLCGNLVIVLGVPGFAQALDWLIHRAVGPAAPAKAVLASTLFTLVSALFHLHVMRRGVFLSGRAGRTLADDLRRIPRLVLDFVQGPYLFVAAMTVRLAGTAESEGAL